MFIDNLRQLVPWCNNTDEDNAIPIRDAEACIWTTTTIAGIGAVDCVAIEACMQPTTDILIGDIGMNRNAISNLTTRVVALEANPVHEHSNLTALDGIISSSTSNRYLWGDGLYHDIPQSYFYQNVRSNSNYVIPRPNLNFASIFSVTDDPTNEQTTISIDPAYLGGWTSGSDDYVSSGTFSSWSNTITLNRVLGWNVFIPLTWLATTDEFVKVGATWASWYLNSNDFENNGTDIEIKKQMSIVSDNAGLRLDGDEETPGTNMLYGTDGAGTKWRVANTTTWQQSFAATLQNVVAAPHNLGKFPAVLCLDNMGEEVMPGWVHYTNDNNITVSFSPAFTGTVYIV